MLCQLLICLTVTLGLSSGHLDATASSLPFGAERSVALAVTRPLHRLASAVGLDRPDQAAAHLLGHSDEAPAPAAGTDRSEAAEGGAADGTAAAAAAPLSPPADPAGAMPPGGAEASDTPSAPGFPGNGPGTASGPAPAGPEGTERPLPYGPPGPAQADPAATAPLGQDPAVDRSPGLGPAVVDATTEAAPARAVDPSNRLRLWAGGDSLGEYVGNQLLAPLSDRSLTSVDLDFHIGTGLTRPDTFDWEARINAIMAGPEPPEALVFMVGGNDNQPMRADGQNLAVGSEPWLAEYRARVGAVLDSVRPPADRPADRHLWWIGLPPMRDGERDSLARAIDAIVAEEAAGRPWVTFVDLMPRFSGPDGGFAGTITGPDGKARVARAPDGIHITYAGSTWIAQDIWADISSRWALPQG